MSIGNKKMRVILKKFLVHFLQEQNFRGEFPEYRRIETNELHLLTIEFDKYGGGFFLELTTHPTKNLQTPWGKYIPIEELTVAHIPLDRRVRLQKTANRHSLPEDWFRFDSLTGKHELRKLVFHVIDLFPQVNEWFRYKRTGPNIFSVGRQ